MRPLIVLLPLILTLAACDRQSAESGQAKPSAGAKASPETTGGSVAAPAKIDTSHAGELTPADAFTTLDGKPAHLADFKGKPVLVNLWATWCAPCVAEMPMLEALAARETARLRVIAISQDMAGKRAVEPYFAKAGFKALTPYLDKENALMLAFKSETLPMTIFYDAEGRERWRVIGAFEWNSAKAQELVAQGLAPAAK